MFEDFTFLGFEILYGTQMENIIDFYMGIMENEIYMNRWIDYLGHLLCQDVFMSPLHSYSGSSARNW